MHTAAHRPKAVAFGLRLTKGTPLASRYYEKQLLARYIRGSLTLAQVLDCLNQPVPAGCLAQAQPPRPAGGPGSRRDSPARP